MSGTIADKTDKHYLTEYGNAVSAGVFALIGNDSCGTRRRQ